MKKLLLILLVLLGPSICIFGDDNIGTFSELLEAVTKGELVSVNCPTPSEFKKKTGVSSMGFIMTQHAVGNLTDPTQIKFTTEYALCEPTDSGGTLTRYIITCIFRNDGTANVYIGQLDDETETYTAIGHLPGEISSDSVKLAAPSGCSNVIVKPL
jgi:hypothetical protein